MIEKREELQPAHAVIDGVRIRYVSSSEGKGRPLLLTSPWPQSILAFHAIWPRLAEVAPLVAIDLPGFGQSESRDDLFEPRAMGNFIGKAVKAFALDRPHAVAPDIGTSAALYAAAEFKDLFSSLVVGGGAVDVILTAGSLKDIIEAEDTKAFQNADGADLVSGSIARLMQSKPSDSEMHDYRDSYAGHRFVQSMAYVRAYPASLPPLVALLPSIEKPVQIVYGLHDPLVPPSNAELLHRLLPHSRLVPLDCGHVTWEDKAEEYGAAVVRWIEGDFNTI